MPFRKSAARNRTWPAPLVLAAWTLVACGACNQPAPPAGSAANLPASARATASGPAPVFISVVSDMESNPQAVDMAMKLAGFSLDEERDVFLFFNVKGVRVPVAGLADDAAFEGNEPIKGQLANLIGRGVVVHVCPICMKALGVEADQLVEGAKVTTRPQLFEKIRSDTVVFTY